MIRPSFSSDLPQRLEILNAAILNSTVRVYVYKDLLLTQGSTITHKLDFDMELFNENPSQSIIQSSSWKYNNVDYYFADEAGEVEAFGKAELTVSSCTGID